MEQLNLKGISSLRNLLTLFILFSASITSAQQFPGSVAIGSTSPAASNLILQLVSTTKAFQPPIMSTTQQNAISSPQEGYLLYDNVLHGVAVYDGSGWQQMFDAANLTGTVPPGTVPTATTSALGLVFAKNATTHNFITGITSGTGAITVAQPAFSDLTGAATAAQLPNPTASTLGGVESAAAVTHQWINSISTSGVPSLSQPAFSDISGTASLTTQVTGLLPIANGGTGQTTKAAGFDALSPCTSNGIIAFGAGTDSCVATSIGNVGLPLVSNSNISAPGFQVLTVAGGGTGYSSIASGTVMVGAGTTSPTLISAGTAGNVLQSDGSTWKSGDGFSLGNLNAANLAVGTLSASRFPALTGDVTSSSGTVATTVAKIQGVAVATTSPTSNQVLQYNGTAWAPGVATTGAGGINWITNGDAETNSTTGWILYNDSAAQPVDCTGGTVVGSPLTTTATSPLSGTYSYLWTHGASNTQGMGFSYAFTLDSASATKVENTQFDMTVASGTWVAGVPQVSDSDQTIWIYDVDSAALIQPTTYRIYSGNSGSFHFQTYWQPVNSTSRNYRLCVHNATATATAYTTKFDSFSVAPATYTYGTPITDWQVSTLTAGTNLTATTTNPAFGTVATNVLRWRRVGANMEFMVDYRQTAAGATAGTGSFLITLPNSAQIDTTLVTTNGGTTTNGYGTVLGDAWLSNAATGIASQSHIGQVIAWDSSHITARFKINASVADTWTSLLWGSSLGASQFNNANLTFHFSGSVPIAGWSSGVQMSDSAPQTLVAAYGASQTPTGTISSTPSVAKFQTVTKDATGAYSTSTGLYTAPVPGWYQVEATLEIGGTANAVNGFTRVLIQLNGVTASQGSVLSQVASGTLNTGPSASAVVFCNAGDTIGILASSSFTSPSYTSALTNSSFAIFRLGDNRTIGATETVAARYFSTASTPGNTSAANAITYTTKDYDTHGFCAGGASCVLPYSGKYRITVCTYQTAATVTAGTAAIVDVLKNGTLIDFNEQYFSGSGAKPMSVCVSDSFSGAAGDSITFKGGNDGTTPAYSSTNGTLVNYFTIERVGN